MAVEEYLSSILITHPVLAPALFIFLRTIPVVIAPIPGVAFDLVGVAMFGWKLGLLLALVGANIGAAVAFFIARYFREPVVKYFVPLQKLRELEARYSGRQKFLGLVALRFITSPFFDFASYAAGLTNISFMIFILSGFISVLPYAFVIYFFGGLALYQGPLYAIMFFAGISILTVILGKVAVKKFLR